MAWVLPGETFDEGFAIFSCTDLQWGVICCLIPGQAWTKTRQGSLQGSRLMYCRKSWLEIWVLRCTVLLLPLTNLTIGTKSNSWYWWRDHIAENILGKEISYFICSDAFLALKICVKNKLKIPMCFGSQDLKAVRAHWQWVLQLWIVFWINQHALRHCCNLRSFWKVYLTNLMTITTSFLETAAQPEL